MTSLQLSTTDILIIQSLGVNRNLLLAYIYIGNLKMTN